VRVLLSRHFSRPHRLKGPRADQIGHRNIYTKRSRNCCCLPPSSWPVYHRFISDWLVNQKNYLFCFDINIVIIQYLYYRRCFVLSWLMMAYYTYRVASWVFLFGIFSEQYSVDAGAQTDTWCNKRESIVWWLVSFEYFVLGNFRGWSESLPPIVDLLSISNSLLFFVLFFYRKSPKRKSRCSWNQPTKSQRSITRSKRFSGLGRIFFSGSEKGEEFPFWCDFEPAGYILLQAQLKLFIHPLVWWTSAVSRPWSGRTWTNYMEEETPGQRRAGGLWGHHQFIIIRNGELAKCCSARLICTCIYLYQRTVRMRSAGPT
jgi:hypothetical protein